jgi:hypothetical protein
VVRRNKMTGKGSANEETIEGWKFWDWKELTGEPIY